MILVLINCDDRKQTIQQRARGTTDEHRVNDNTQVNRKQTKTGSVEQHVAREERSYKIKQEMTEPKTQNMTRICSAGVWKTSGNQSCQTNVIEYRVQCFSLRCVEVKKQ